MTVLASPPRRPHREQRPSRARLAILVPVLALGLAALPRFLAPLDAPPPAAAKPVRTAIRPPAPVRDLSALFAQGTVLGEATPTFADSAPLTADLVPNLPDPETVLAFAEPPEEEPAPVPAPAAQSAAPARLAEAASAPVPLPVPRPAELRPRPARLAQQVNPAPRARTAARQEAAAEQSFFEAVFGAREAEAPGAPAALAYARPEREGGLFSPRSGLGSPLAPTGATAIYDISARTVTLPNGEVLEAHSGLGHAQDNPRHVHLRMRGATPPGTYDLTEREALFHGVRAIRLHPVGGSRAIHGRDGLLAHTYMLGPSGASNGCVVFRDYNRFLQAYLRGEIRRLVVVAGGGFDSVASAGDRLFGGRR